MDRHETVLWKTPLCEEGKSFLMSKFDVRREVTNMLQVRAFSSFDEMEVENGINSVFSGLKREKLIDIKYSISTCVDSDPDSLTGFRTEYSALVIYEE
jgi:hypothetical protein